MKTMMMFLMAAIGFVFGLSKARAELPISVAAPPHAEIEAALPTAAALGATDALREMRLRM